MKPDPGWQAPCPVELSFLIFPAHPFSSFLVSRAQALGKVGRVRELLCWFSVADISALSRNEHPEGENDKWQFIQTVLLSWPVYKN